LKIKIISDYSHKQPINSISNLLGLLPPQIVLIYSPENCVPGSNSEAIELVGFETFKLIKRA